MIEAGGGINGVTYAKGSPALSFLNRSHVVYSRASKIAFLLSPPVEVL